MVDPAEEGALHILAGNLTQTQGFGGIFVSPSLFNVTFGRPQPLGTLKGGLYPWVWNDFSYFTPQPLRLGFGRALAGSA